ncbi:alpha/beta hydrolase [Actinomadura montaniterrae]|uniref:Alpha/beta hydrolase n=1 Tax=Actinomadura montaniterrae TaxID=1803903 RepID=A0A6L3VY58_9ACTN|nr:alpha/beta hydrolase [Actinomadura montaniterrae]KAB2384836.1 alpha/beta hydrolase [Actinomadura montaniterrae]
MPTDYDELRRRRMAELDEDLSAVYKAVGNGRDLREMGVETVRRSHAAMLSAQKLPEGVTVETVEVPGPAGAIPTKIYHPANGGDRGVYVHTHAGGWISMNGLEHVDGMNGAHVRDWGCTVVHPDFRVPPEHKFPAAIEDCWATVQWVHDNAQDLGVDRGRIAVGGGCTGANIAAVMALMARDEGSPDLALQVLLSPQLDTREDYRSHFEFASGYGLSRDSDLYVIEQYLADPEQRWDWRASPVLAESVRGVCPALIAVGEWEVLRDETRFYAARLRDAGVHVDYLEGEKAGHGYTGWRVPGTGELIEVAKRHNAEIDRIVRDRLGPR